MPQAPLYSAPFARQTHERSPIDNDDMNEMVDVSTLCTANSGSFRPPVTREEATLLGEKGAPFMGGQDLPPFVSW